MRSLFLVLIAVSSAVGTPALPPVEEEPSSSTTSTSPPPEAPASTSSTSMALGNLGGFDPNPFPIIERFTSSKDIANVGDSVELECEASDRADHDPFQEHPDHDLEIEIFYVGERNQDLSASGWWIDIETGKKRRPSHPSGRIDITERAGIYMYKESVTLNDKGFYACRACIYKGTENEKCDIDDRLLLLRVVDQNKIQDYVPTEEGSVAPLYTIELPRSTCQIFGDPQVITFDQKFYRLPASSCDYILALDADQGRWFIYGRARPCGYRVAGFCLESVTIYTQEDVVELQRGWVINHRGEKVETRDLSGERQIGPFRASFVGTNLQIKVLLSEEHGQFGEKEIDWLVVAWDGFTAVTIQAPMTTRTGGACGNNDQDPDNDFYLRGQANHDVTNFADSLQIYGRQRCEPGREPLESQEMQIICGDYLSKAQKKCDRIFNSNHQFEYCFTDKKAYIEGCIYDECKGFNIQNTLYPWITIPKVDRLLKPGCAAAEAYAYKCSEEWWDLEGFKYAKVTVEGWERESYACPTPDVKKLNIPRMGCPQSFMPENYDN